MRLSDHLRDRLYGMALGLMLALVVVGAVVGLRAPAERPLHWRGDTFPNRAAASAAVTSAFDRADPALMLAGCRLGASLNRAQADQALANAVAAGAFPSLGEARTFQQIIDAECLRRFGVGGPRA